MFENEITDCCKALKLGAAMAKTSKSIEATTHQEFLYKILLEEIKRRDEAKRVRYLNTAGFYSIKTFEGYRFDEVKLPAALSPDSIKNGDFIERKENLVLYGNVGTGKTHMATAIGVNACNAGKEVKFFRTAALVNYLSEQKSKGNLTKVLKAINKADCCLAL